MFIVLLSSSALVFPRCTVGSGPIFIVGDALAQSTLTVSTYGILDTTAGDPVYMALEGKIAAWTATRDGLAAQIKALLEGAEFGGDAINEQQAKGIISQAQTLLDEAAACAANPGNCAK